MFCEGLSLLEQCGGIAPQENILIEQREALPKGRVAPYAIVRGKKYRLFITMPPKGQGSGTLLETIN